MGLYVILAVIHFFELIISTYADELLSFIYSGLLHISKDRFLLIGKFVIVLVCVSIFMMAEIIV